LSSENSKLYTNEKSNYLTNNTVSSVGPRPNCWPVSTFYWAAQHLLWAVFTAPVAWAQTWATVTTSLCSPLMSAALPVCRGKLGKLRADCFTVGLYWITITWERTFTCALCVLPHASVKRKKYRETVSSNSG